MTERRQRRPPKFWKPNMQYEIVTACHLAKNGWVAIEVAPQWEAWAIQTRKERDKRYRNIFAQRSSDSRWVGDLGERVFDWWLRSCGAFNHQWILDDTAGKADFISSSGLCIGVKTVKRKVPPRLDYTAQITAQHAKEPIDHFFFMTYEFQKRRMWLLGGIDRQTFLDNAKYYAAGDKVHDDYVIREGHEIWNVEVGILVRPADWYQKHFNRP